MSVEDRTEEDVLRLLRLLADQLENFLEGEETAFDTLAERLEEHGFSSDDLQSAILVLRSLGSGGAAVVGIPGDGVPGKHTLRILSEEERDALSTEAWGYLLDLRRHGSLDPGQFERVLDLLTGSGIRPVGIDLAREVATRVALQVEEGPILGDPPHGDIDAVH